MVSVPGPTRPSLVRVRHGAPDELGGSSSGLEHLFSRRSEPGRLHPWARAGSHGFPGDPSQAFALLHDPGRAGKTSPLAVVPTPPPGYPNRRPQRVHNLEANTGLQLPLSKLRERRRRLLGKTCFRLAGCASTGRGSNPLDRFERFQVTSILLSRASPVARVSYANFCSEVLGCGAAGGGHVQELRACEVSQLRVFIRLPGGSPGPSFRGAGRDTIIGKASV
jgi:hypothetical protein